MGPHCDTGCPAKTQNSGPPCIDIGLSLYLSIFISLTGDTLSLSSMSKTRVYGDDQHTYKYTEFPKQLKI